MSYNCATCVELVLQLADAREKLSMAKTALIEARDHLYDKQDIGRVRELARLALSEIVEQ